MIATKANFYNRVLKRRGKYAFIESLARGAQVLDVGCGNNSPRRFKGQRPDCRYFGIDVQDYNQDEASKEYADRYIVTTSDNFAAAIREFTGQMDAVISSHNLEHCDAPREVLGAMLSALCPGGRIYLAFPAEESLRFPIRQGHLNFFDDPSHKTVPRWDETTATIRTAGLEIDFAAKRYRPFALAAMGLILEPGAALLHKSAPAHSTWALYGFESLIWASKPRFHPAGAENDRERR